MTGLVTGGIIRAATQIASTGLQIASTGLQIASTGTRLGWTVVLVMAFSLSLLSIEVPAGQADQDGFTVAPELDELQSFVWDFGRSSDPHFRKWPEGWKRVEGIGYPSYVEAKIVARDEGLEHQFKNLDAAVLLGWQKLRKSFPRLPVPPSVVDANRRSILSN